MRENLTAIFHGLRNNFAPISLPVFNRPWWRNTFTAERMEMDYPLKTSKPRKREKLLTSEITVENIEFSTFSTDFSTMVFHSGKVRRGKSAGYIKKDDGLWQSSNFFDCRNFAGQLRFCAKFRTWHPRDWRGRARRTHRRTPGAI